MKIFLQLSIFCTISFTTIAQLPNCTTDLPFQNRTYEILKNLDKSQIPSGVLYDYVYPMAELEMFPGTASTDTSNQVHFTDAYYEAYYSTINRSNLIHPDDYRLQIQNFHPNPEFHHPVGIIDYQYHNIKSNAVVNNQFSVSNGQLYDVANRTGSPYQLNTTKVASLLLVDSLDCLKPGIHYFYLSQQFILSNTNFNINSITSISIFKDGIPVSSNIVYTASNITIPILFANEQKNFTLTFIVNTFYEQSTFKMTACQLQSTIPILCDGANEINITGDFFDGGYGSKGAFAAKGKASIYYGAGNCAFGRITKPIIFVDGFDAMNKQHARELWSKYINKSFDGGNNIQRQLGAELRAAGYDVIIWDQVQHGNKSFNTAGGGLIENNGVALAKFIQVLYARYNATMTDEIVVVGASMGGIIARYALAYMEHNNIPHHTRLFVSFDSPQYGAQIPIGLQQAVDRITQYSLAQYFDEAKYALHQSDAAKQMVFDHSTSGTETVQSHPYRAQLKANLAAVGDWPKKCRMISIMDGNKNGILKSISGNGTDTPNINPCDNELDFTLKFRDPVKNAYGYGHKMKVQVYAQTNAPRCKSMEFSIKLPVIFDLIHPFAPPFPLYDVVTKYTQPTSNTSYDIAPGSRIGKDPLLVYDTLSNKTKMLINLAAGKINIANNSLKFSNFVPSVSAAGYLFPNNEPYNINKSLENIVLNRCSGNVVFDTVYVFNKDLDHVQIDVNLANAFLQEILNPKLRSICVGECPSIVQTSTPLLNNTTGNIQAQNSICLLPGFKVNNGSVVKFEIGCGQVPSSLLNLGNFSPQPPALPSILSTCPLAWSTTENQVICGVGFTTFKVFVKNVDLGDYAEFSTNNSLWLRANIGDNGKSFIFNANPGQPQTFYARSLKEPNTIINIALNHCP